MMRTSWNEVECWWGCYDEVGGAARSGPGGNSIHVLLMKLNTEELKRRRVASVGKEMSALANNAFQFPMQQTRFGQNKENTREEIKWQWKTVCAS